MRQQQSLFSSFLKSSSHYSGCGENKWKSKQKSRGLRGRDPVIICLHHFLSSPYIVHQIASSCLVLTKTQQQRGEHIFSNDHYNSSMLKVRTSPINNKSPITGKVPECCHKALVGRHLVKRHLNLKKVKIIFSYWGFILLLCMISSIIRNKVSKTSLN